MPAIVLSTRRAGAVAAFVPLFILLCSTLCLTGCGATAPRGSDADPDYGNAYAGSVSAREYGFVRPSRDASGAEGAPKRSFWQRLGFASRDRGGATDDLWARVRAGMQLDHASHARIDAMVQQFSRNPRYLERLSSRAGPYLHPIVTEIERRGLPQELALLPYVESGFNPAATSPKAAAGLWQFMPYTGREMGLRQDQWSDERRDILASTRAALDYLERLNRRFDGDWALTLAAYNCGPGCVGAAREANLLAGRPTDFWSLNLPQETRDYVPKVLAAARLVAAPERHGQHLPTVPNRPQMELVRAPGPVDLVRVATVSGIHLTEIKRLNPGHKQERTAPDTPAQVLVPAGTARKLSARMDEVAVTR